MGSPRSRSAGARRARGRHPLVLHPARLADAGRLAELCRQLGYPASRRQLQERLRRIGSDSEHAVCVAEDRQAGVIGWVHVHVKRTLEEGPQAEIGGLVVGERWRGSGVGRRLMARAEAWARARGCRALRLRTNIVRRGAHRFYAALGYRHLKTQKVFAKLL